MQPARRDLRTGTRRPRLNGSDRAVSWHWLLCPRNQDRAPFRFIPKFPIGTPPSELLGVIVICDYAGWAEHKRSRALRRKILAQGDRASKVAANYYFWDGESKLETIIGSWRKRLNRLFEPAEVTSGHSHRLRDTFAVELLLAGVPIVRVSILLGHESVRTTERNYAPWVRSRQEQLEADLTRAWGLDPLIAAQTPQARGTRRVHEKKQRSTSHILRLKIGGAGGIRTHEWRFCRPLPWATWVPRQTAKYSKIFGGARKLAARRASTPRYFFAGASGEAILASRRKRADSSGGVGLI
jgi:Phage integrase family